MSSAVTGQLFKQPASVWAIAFATAVSFIGIGLVSPILPTISAALNASAFESMLLFTSYMLVTACTMFFAGAISSRLGIKATLVSGLLIVMVFATLVSFSDSIGQIIGLRGGWGFGNALFVTMALAGIIGASHGVSTHAITLYGAALGIGMAVGPLVGGTLGTISWRAPFLATAVLMGVAAVTVAMFVESFPKRVPAPMSSGLTSLRQRPLLLWSTVAMCSNFTIVCLLAYAPHVVAGAAISSGLNHSSLTLGFVFLGWGSAFAIFSLVFPAPMIRLLGLVPAVVIFLVLMGGGMLLLALNTHNMGFVIPGIIMLGGLQGAANTMLIEAAMNATTLPRNISSSSFSAFVFFGGAIFPLVAAPLIAQWGAPGPFWGSLIALVIAILLVVVGYRTLSDAQRQRGRLASRAASVPAQTNSPKV